MEWNWTEENASGTLLVIMYFDHAENNIEPVTLVTYFGVTVTFKADSNYIEYIYTQHFSQKRLIYGTGSMNKNGFIVH